MADQADTNNLKRNHFIERKIRYDRTIAEYDCTLLQSSKKQVILLHEMERAFSMPAGREKLTIPVGSFTIAYYWTDKPYNVYTWKDRNGNYLGAYFNIVKNTRITDLAVIFEDLIIDILVRPDGHCFILDENELPAPLDQFENGSVKQVMHTLVDSLDRVLNPLLQKSGEIFKNDVSRLIH
ncbi:DUF402 domain-containing protein [Sporolactobacillus sp. THM7-7]|nr:DUF402 domain-containing protein [Sporolactobacillus sp. THM7-7]